MKLTRTRKIALGLTLAASAIAGAAYAGQAAIGDGVLTRAEAQAKAQEMFARMDFNKDGKLDEADRAAHRAAMFDRIDTDHNGQISRAEFDAAGPGPGGMGGMGHMGHGDMGSAGHDHDGPGGPDGDGPGMAPGGMHHGGGMMMMGRMADTNKDGAVSQAEFAQAALQHFDQADANHDGKLTREERQAAHKAMGERMREHWQHRMDEPGAPTAPGK